MICEKSILVQRFHDGEVPAAERGAIETHLRECADCRSLLTDLQRLSQAIEQARPARIDAQAAQRIHNAWYTAKDRSVRRAAGWLTAAAAAVLLAALLTSPAGPAESGTLLPVWQTVAVRPSAGDQDEAGEAMVTAQWMADDLLASDTR